MKILLIGHFWEKSGFADASFGYLNALLTTGHDIVARSVNINGSPYEIAADLQECFDKSVEGVEVVIQHLLPHHMSYIPDVKNVGLFVYDLNDPRYCEWDRYLNCMDEIWSPYDNPIWGNLLSVPVYCVPHAFDTSKFAQKYEKLPIKELDGTFVFYTIADANTRKNIKDTLIAFHTEFHPNEPVSFVLKSSYFGSSSDNLLDSISKSINTIKADLKLYPYLEDYHQEIIISNRLSDEQIMQLHQTGDAYISSSRGEGFNIPLFNAWAMGNQCITYLPTDFEFPYKEELYTIINQRTPCFGYTDTFPQLATAREWWGGSDIPSLMKNMRYAYDGWFRDTQKQDMSKFYERFSYENVGKLIKELL